MCTRVRMRMCVCMRVCARVRACVSLTSSTPPHHRRPRDTNRCIFDIHNLGYQGPFPNPPFSEAPPFSFCDFGLKDNAYYDKSFWVCLYF